MRHYLPSLILPVTPAHMSRESVPPAVEPAPGRVPPWLRDAGAALVVLGLLAIGTVLPFCG